MRIKVTCEVPDRSEPAQQNIKVHSHWGNKDFVTIEIGGKNYTVEGNGLKNAVDNCMNVGI